MGRRNLSEFADGVAALLGGLSEPSDLLALFPNPSALASAWADFRQRILSSHYHEALVALRETAVCQSRLGGARCLCVWNSDARRSVFVSLL